MAKREMFEHNLRLVRAIAGRYRGRGVPFADLVQEGTIGLVRAVEGFDHRRGLKFSTYAVWWIRRSMYDAINAAPMIRIPAQAAREIAAIRRAEAQLAGDGAPPASAEAVAELTGLAPRTVRELRDAARVARSLDEPVGEQGAALGELIADRDGVDPVDAALHSEVDRDVSSMLLMLPERHRQVLRHRYGLDGARVQSHAEIGAALGVGEERSRQLEHEALRRLREVVQPLRPAA